MVAEARWMWTCARVAVAVKSKIERDLIVLSSLLLEARFFAPERLSGCSRGRVRCAEVLWELQEAPNANGFDKQTICAQRVPPRTPCPWARVRVGSGLVVVMASDGRVLGWGNHPKHQGEARPRLNTCASPAGARRPRAVTPRTCHTRD